jgi:uncharacterized damage-inducible protein DinB
MTGSLPHVPPKEPAGPYLAELHPDANRREELISSLERFPAKLRSLVGNLSDGQLDTRYANWTVRQIVHHLADSHVNAYIRTRLALTEDEPTIKPYDESKWSQLADAATCPVEPSLRLLEALHVRWIALLRSLTERDFLRKYFHPQMNRVVSLNELLGLYAHHGAHHAAQIRWLYDQHHWR